MRLYARSATKLMALLLALILVLGMTGCTAKDPEPGGEESSVASGGDSSSRPDSSGEEEPEEPEPPSYREAIAEWQQENSDVVGWLMCPNTSIDEYVLHYDKDNEYYLRKDVYKRWSQAGVYYADFRNTFDGTAQGLSRNTVIYGHSLDLQDNPDAPYFSQLKRYLKQEFAEENPYIYFSVGEEDLVWEVFAVFYSSVNLPYNTPDMTNEEFSSLISEVTKRSEYIYDVNVSSSDKILTLSTCTYQFTPGVYPNDYRYVVMAKLKTDDEPLKERATLEKNPSPKDP